MIDRRELARLGVVSAPRFRAYIAAHSVAWRPGVTRRRHPRNRGVHLWSSNPGNYPVLTGKDRDRLAFGNVDRGRKEGRAKADAYWEALPGVEILTRQASTLDGRRGWLIVPQEAAAAIAWGATAEGAERSLPPDRGPREGANRGKRALTGGRKDANRGKRTP